MPTTRLAYFVGSLELVLAAIGVLLLWRLVVRREARARPVEAKLLPWDVAVPDFLVFIVLVLGCSFAVAAAASLTAKYLPFRGDEVTVFNGAAAQLGMLAGVAAYWLQPGRRSAAPRAGGTHALVSGGATFLISLPVLIAISKAWEYVLEICHLPTEKQDLIGMFMNAESPILLVTMITLAIVIA